MPQSILTNTAASAARTHVAAAKNLNSISNTSGRLTTGMVIDSSADLASTVVNISKKGAQMANNDRANIEMSNKASSVGVVLLNNLQEMGVRVENQINDLKAGKSVDQGNVDTYNVLADNFAAISSGSVGGLNSNPFNGSSSIYVTGSDGKSSSYTFAKVDSESVGLSNVNMNDAESLSGLRDRINNAISNVSEGMGVSASVIMGNAKNMSLTVENLSATKSVFTDTDISDSLSKAQSIKSMVDAASAMMSQSIESSNKLAELVRQVYM